jgi:RNA polymerase sigma-70 factor (sigma-E family)
MPFEDWVRSRLGGLLRFAMALCCDAGLAEDVVQEVLVKAHRRWDTIERLDNPEAYVRRMIVNEHLNWRRKWARYLPFAEIRGARPVADHAELYAERAELIGELAKLPPRQRAVLALRYYAGLTDAEIAETLSCRPSTVRSQAARALAALRIELRPGAAVPGNGSGASHAN